MSSSKAPSLQNTIQVASGAQVQPISFGMYPAEGTKICTTRYNWGSQLGYYEDLQSLRLMGMETSIQSVFVDNSQNDSSVTIIVSGTDQVLVVGANAQGIYPIFLTDGPAFFITTSSIGGYTTLLLLNVPCQTSGQWSTATNDAGPSQTPLVGTQVFTGSYTAGANNVVVPAVAGLSVFVSAITMTLDANATIAAPGEALFSIRTNPGAAVLANASAFIGAAVPIVNTGPIPLLQTSGLQYIGPVGSAIDVGVGATLVTGDLRVTIFGGYTTNLP